MPFDPKKNKLQQIQDAIDNNTIDIPPAAVNSIDNFLERTLGPDKSIQVPTNLDSSQNYGRIKSRIAPRQYVGTPNSDASSIGDRPPVVQGQPIESGGYFNGYRKVDSMSPQDAQQELNSMQSITKFPIIEQENAMARQKALMKKAGY